MPRDTKVRCVSIVTQINYFNIKIIYIIDYCNNIIIRISFVRVSLLRYLKGLETKQIKEDDPALVSYSEERNQAEIFRRQKSSRKIMNFVFHVTHEYVFLIKNKINI